MADIAFSKIISVIIAAKGSCRYLLAAVESVLANDFDSFEVVVVDDGIDQEVIEQLSRLPVRILKNPGAGPSAARNFGVENSDSVLVAFMDDDCIAAQDCLSQLYNGLISNLNSAACGGAQLLPEDSGAFARRVYTFLRKSAFISDYVKNSSKAKTYEVNHNASCNVLYRKEDFSRVGGFLEGLWPGEDLELDYKLKQNSKVLLNNPKAVVYHYRPDNMQSFARMMLRYGWAQGFLVRRYGPFRIMHYVPLVLLFLVLLALFSLAVEPMLLISIMLIGELFLFAYCQGDLILNYMFFLALVKWNIGFIEGFYKK